MSTSCNALSECRSFTYDARGMVQQITFSTTASPTRTYAYDENGRLASAANGNGTVTDLYDQDGRNVARSQTVGAQPPVSIGYSYYPSGERRAVGITTSQQSFPTALGYSYRADGVLQTLTSVGSTRFDFTYTGGRRPLRRSDNTGQTADTMAYDSAGRTTAVTLPAWYENTMQYNAEGQQISAYSYVWNNGAFYPGAILAATYSSRGEVVKELIASGSTTIPLLANGTRISGTQLSMFSFNSLQGMPVSKTEGGVTATYSYDAVGRQTRAAGDDGTSYNKQYDAEDQLLTHTVPAGFIGHAQKQYSLAYTWGPIGHPVQMGSTSVVRMIDPRPMDFQFESLYWDGDALMFTTDSAGQIDDIKIGGGIADYTPKTPQSPLTVWDRESLGQLLGCHNNTGFAGMSPRSAFQPASSSCLLTTAFTGQNPPVMVGHGALIISAKTDGISDGTNVFQGVRTYDSQAGVWTTPDAYRGDVHDPMSQKPYMWNRNDPYSYSDPSGLVPTWDVRWDDAWNNAQGFAGSGDNSAEIAAAKKKATTKKPPTKRPIRSRLADLLPTEGEAPYVPPSGKGEIRTNSAGEIPDAYGNWWRWDQVKSEWDVQTPIHGGKSLHTNINAQGIMTHGEWHLPQERRPLPQPDDWMKG